MTFDDRTPDELVGDAVTARPLRRYADPDYVKAQSVEQRKADAWRVMRAAADRPDEFHTLDVWGTLAGLRTSPHRRASDMRAAGMLVPVEMAKTLSGANAMGYACHPDLIARFRTEQ